MARALGRMLVKMAEAAAVAKEVVDLQSLVAHCNDIAIKPGLVNDIECFVIELPDIHAQNFRLDLGAQAIHFQQDKPPYTKEPASNRLSSIFKHTYVAGSRPSV
jgi:hypothetical protein